MDALKELHYNLMYRAKHLQMSKHALCLHVFQGIRYLVRHNVLEDSAIEIAKFINCTGALYGKSVSEYLNIRLEVNTYMYNSY